MYACVCVILGIFSCHGSEAERTPSDDGETRPIGRINDGVAVSNSEYDDIFLRPPCCIYVRCVYICLP